MREFRDGLLVKVLGTKRFTSIFSGRLMVWEEFLPIQLVAEIIDLE